jgi:type I restriction enzyme, S subunit
MSQAKSKTAPQWPWIPFAKALSDNTAGQPKVLRRDYLGRGALAVIDQGATTVAGYTDDWSMAYRGTLPVILFGDHTRLVKYVDFPFALGADGVKALEPTPAYVAKFLYYYLVATDIPQRGYSRHFQFLREIQCPLAALSEQRRIVEILDQAARLRCLRAEADAKADRILPALFIKMFGDPGTNPMGWLMKPLGDLTEHLTSGSRGWSKYTGRGPACFLRTQDINDGDIADNLLPVDPPDGAEAERTRLAVGDVAITITGIVGKAAVFRGHDRPVYVNQHVALVRPKTDELCSEYLAAYANFPLGDVPVLARFQYGQTKPGLGFQELRTARILLAPLERQRAFARRVNAVQISRHAGTAASKALAALWTSLLSRAFSGDLTGLWREARMKDLLQEMEHQANALAVTARPE